MRAIPDRWEIPCWLAGISMSFLIGLAMLRGLPGWSTQIFDIGTLVNVSMALVLGGLLTYRDRHWLTVPAGIVVGTVATVAWLNILGFSVGSDVGVSVAIELVFGYIGMSILVGSGALLGCGLRHAAQTEACKRRRLLR
jgi:hypothetical protein